VEDEDEIAIVEMEGYAPPRARIPVDEGAQPQRRPCPRKKTFQDIVEKMKTKSAIRPSPLEHATSATPFVCLGYPFDQVDDVRMLQDTPWANALRCRDVPGRVDMREVQVMRVREMRMDQEMPARSITLTSLSLDTLATTPRPRRSTRLATKARVDYYLY
jgi:hypothetical protein